MIQFVLFTHCQTPDLYKFDKLLFRESWMSETEYLLQSPENAKRLNSAIEEIEWRIIKSPPKTSSISRREARKAARPAKVYKTHDTLGRPIPRRDENGRWIKKDCK